MSTSTFVPARSGAPVGEHAEPQVAPIIAAVDASNASRAAAEEAAVLAAELEAPLVFVYVRGRPLLPLLGAPFHQRRLSKELARARRALDHAVGIARAAGIEADAEILEGTPHRRITEFARDRGAQLVVLGSRRPRLGRSVAWATARAADRPVVVAAPRPKRLALG